MGVSNFLFITPLQRRDDESIFIRKSKPRKIFQVVELIVTNLDR